MSHDDAFLLFPLRGQLETRDFLLIGEMIMAQAALHPSPRILLDWSEITSWKFRKPPDRRLLAWMEEAGRVDRLAIVHNSIGNRQAALLSAVFRQQRCWVRSYRPVDRSRAIDWLTTQRPLDGSTG